VSHPSRQRSLALYLAVLLAAAALCLAPASLLAQTQDDFPGNEPGTTEERFERSDLGNVAQSSRFSYAAGVRELEKARKLTDKAASTSDAAKRAKLEENVKTAYEKAISSLTDAIQTDPQMLEAYAPLGRAYYETGDMQKAAGVHGAALRLDPGDTENQEARAEAMLGLDLIREAALAYESLRASDKKLASQLLDRMKQYVATRRADPGPVPPEAVEALASLIQGWEAG
jgi:tetratricopeptide (TPR) repeat protein